MSCNLLDCMLLFGMMVILDMGSVSVTDSNPAASMAMVMAFVVIMLLSILLNLLNGGYRYFQQKYRKQFRFFTCHQKNAAGSMARLHGWPKFCGINIQICWANTVRMTWWFIPELGFPMQIAQGVPAKVLEDGTGTTQPWHQDLYRLWWSYRSHKALQLCGTGLERVKYRVKQHGEM